MLSYVENTHQIVYVGLCQAYVLGAHKQPGRSVTPGGVQAKVATLALDDDTVPADAHGVACSRQTVRQSSHLIVGENEGLGSAPPNDAEFHQGLIIACRLETDRQVVCLSSLMKNMRRSKTRLGSKAGLGGQ